MGKRVFIIHGWEGSPNKGWRLWLKNELIERNFQVSAPSMPNTTHPKQDEWVSYLAHVVGSPDKNCYFVGHSLGCIAILRYLESFKKYQKVGGVVFVAGFTSNLGYDELDSFFETKIEWGTLLSHCNKWVAIHSTNDPYVSIHYGDFFKTNLGAQVIIEKNKKHFGEGDSIAKLPSALNSILRMNKK